ncbi:MAG: hypothetical protein QUS12_15410, partial [Methanosarcina sp.]|nr:hypothetical protein [Methanosarcina sp.]
ASDVYKRQSFNSRENIMEKGRDKQPPDFSEIRNKMMEIDALENKKIEEMLTAEQLESYKKFMEERSQRRPPGPDQDSSNSPPPPPPRW